MSSVTYEHFTKRFGEVTAVNDLDIHIEDKEFLVFNMDVQIVNSSNFAETLCEVFVRYT